MKLAVLAFSVIGAGFILLMGQAAGAAMRYKIYEDLLGTLTLEAEGSLSLPLTSGQSTCGVSGGLEPLKAGICTGSAALSPLFQVTGPPAFASGGGLLFPASSVSGITTGLLGANGLFIIDASYTPQASIFSQAVFAGKTLASAGLTPTSGNLGTWTLVGSGDTITVDVVPAPLSVLGAGAAFGFSRRLRQRIRGSQASRNS